MCIIGAIVKAAELQPPDIANGVESARKPPLHVHQMRRHDHQSARYLTPSRVEGREIYGAAYGADSLICLNSLRSSSAAHYRHADRVYIMPDELTRVREMEGDFLYLGHFFQHYGHFLMETLPMLSYALQARDSGIRFVFLPFWKADEHSLILRFFDLLGLDRSRVFLHDAEDVLVGNFSVPKRPIVINAGILDPMPYRHVIKNIKDRLGLRRSRSSSRRVFLRRDPTRTDADYASHAEQCFSNAGFDILRPESLALEEQVALIHHAEIIAGFSGSALHNAMFAAEGALVIEIGDKRHPTRGTANQLACQAIVGARSAFIPYIPSQPSSLQTMVGTLSKLSPRDRWTAIVKRRFTLSESGILDQNTVIANKAGMKNQNTFKPGAAAAPIRSRLDRKIPEAAYLYALMLFSVIAASISASFLKAGHNWGDDFGAYLHLAKNIQLGRPYGYLTPEMAAMTPPGYPFLMSLWSRMTGWDMMKLKTVNVFAWSLLAIATYRLARVYLSALASLATAVAVLCCPFFVFAEQELISDMPYAAVNTACLLLACVAASTSSDRRRVGWLIALAAGVFIALLFRPAAVGLIAALLGYQCYALLHGYVRARSVDRYALLGGVVLVLSSALFIAIFPGPFKAHGANAVANGHFYSFLIRSREEFANFTHLFFGYAPVTWQPLALLGIAFSGAVAGAASRRELTPLHFFAAVYTAMIVLTPWDGGPRYLFPLVPVVFIFTAMLGEYALKSGASAKVGKVIAVLVLWCLACNGARQIEAARGYSDDDVDKPQAVALVTWLAANTQADDTLCAFKPRAIMYLAQRRTLHIGFDAYAGQGNEYLQQKKCAYAVIPDLGALGGLYNGVSTKATADPTLRKVYDNSMYSVFMPVEKKQGNEEHKP